MPPLRIHLKPNANPTDVARMLSNHLLMADNALGAVSGLELRDAYLKWEEVMEQLLRNAAYDPEVRAMLQSARYWEIRRLDASAPRPWPLIQAEIQVQKEAITSLVEDLLNRASRLSAAPGSLAVLDTNIFLHSSPLNEIPWKEVLDSEQVRLVIPLRVVEELDAKKYDRQKDVAYRARVALRGLDAVLGPAGAPGELCPGVTIEVPIDERSRLRPADADGEILDDCRELALITGRSITLVTRDMAMRLRAEGRHIAVREIPDTPLALTEGQ